LKFSKIALQSLLINQRQIVKHYWFLLFSYNLCINRGYRLLLYRMIKGNLWGLLKGHRDRCRGLGSSKGLLILKVEVNCWRLLKSCWL